MASPTLVPVLTALKTNGHGIELIHTRGDESHVVPVCWNELLALGLLALRFRQRNSDVVIPGLSRRDF